MNARVKISTSFPHDSQLLLAAGQKNTSGNVLLAIKSMHSQPCKTQRSWRINCERNWETFPGSQIYDIKKNVQMRWVACLVHPGSWDSRLLLVLGMIAYQSKLVAQLLIKYACWLSLSSKRLIFTKFSVLNTIKYPGFICEKAIWTPRTVNIPQQPSCNGWSTTLQDGYG